MGIQRLLTLDRQAVTGATATSTKPSEAIKRTAVNRTGNGLIAVSGPYTGDTDTLIDVEIVAGGANRITRPSFAGVGSGDMSDLAVLAGATPQKWTLALIDLGVDTATAETEIEGFVLRALVAGAVGNSISLDVDQTGITETTSSYSLIDPISKGTSTVQGVGFDWDTAVGTETDIPTTAKRLTIGTDYTIYRQWKYYKDGEWNYRFMPEISQDHPAGTAVQFVTGTRSVTITDGVTPETYPNIITLYDLLAAIRDTPSLLVEVVGVISPDLTVDNPSAVLDLRTRTDAHVAYTSGEGSSSAIGFVDYSAGANADTELITAECYDISIIGQEQWKLSGSVAGSLGVLETGIAFVESAGKFGLKIPVKLPDGYDSGSRGDISSDVVYAERASGNPPAICIDALRLGPNATDKTITWTYTQRPAFDCPCENLPYNRLPGSCLTGDPGADLTGEPEYSIRLDRLNAYIYKLRTFNSSYFTSHLDYMHNLLKAIFSGAYSWDNWAAGHVYSEGDAIQSGSYKYRALDDGTSGGTVPTFPNAIGETVVDNGVTWLCLTKKPLDWWDDLLDELKDIRIAEDQQVESQINWTADIKGCSVSVGDQIYLDENGLTRHITIIGKVTTAGTLGDPQDWTTGTGGTINYHDVITNTGGTAVIEIEEITYCYAYSTNTCPTLVGFPLLDCDNSTIDNESDVRNYLNGYEIDILTAAEVAPNYKPPEDKEECWPDPGDGFWWVPDQAGYLPAFTNQEYHSVKTKNGDIVSTHEFGFVIKVDDSCASSLIEGDSVKITIGDAGWPPTYQIGDRLYLATVAAGALDLVGGVDGTDELTWQVIGSISGQGADYVVDKTAPALYDNGQIQARINLGGVDYTLGDTYTFCVETGQYRWRQDGGSWSTATDIGAGPLVDGLTIDFTEGACPSFVSGDSASFTALQPHAVSSASAPDDGRYAWDGAGTVITLPCTGTVDALAIGMHTLPTGATVVVSDGVTNWPMTIRPGVMVQLFNPALSSPTLTVTITNATDAEIGWLWAGNGLSVDADASNDTKKRIWDMTRGAGLNPTAAHRGTGVGWAATWSGFITRVEMESIESAIGSHKQAGDLPAVFIPADDNPDYASMIMFPDTIETADFFSWACPGNENIEFSMDLVGWKYG